MNTKNILRTMALAMLLVTACNKEIETENTAGKGYTLPVTVSVTRQADDPATKATYNESTRKLEFSAGDQLFVQGGHDTAGDFAGTLDYDTATGKFSGTITAENPYSGTADAFFSSAAIKATLLPAGYESYGYLFIDDNGTGDVLYDDYIDFDDNKAIAESKAAGVAQFSLEQAWGYDDGFALEPQNAILNFTITGLTASTEVDVEFGNGSVTISGSVATDGDGTATFAIGVIDGTGLNSFVLTVGGNDITLVSESKTLAAGKIYNINRSAAPAGSAVDLSMVDCAGNARAKQWTANCYMVHTAGDYKLPLVYGNAIKDGATNAAAYTGVTSSDVATATFPRHDGNAITAPWIKDNGITVASAELLWQDAEGLVTAVGIDGDYLTLTVGKDATAQEGNAVIAAKLEDGTVVWSWHIWVTKETFADANLTTITTGTGTLGIDYQVYQVTPVNLGWVATGGDGKQGYAPFYQWGRKDAFKGTGAPADANVYNISGTAVTGLTCTASSDATIADNIKNPTTHYYNSSNYGPCNTTYYNMWDAQNTATDNNVTTATKKTVYDPCPPGFCVPTGNLYSYANGQSSSITWDGTNMGRTWSTWSGVFFPASGYRKRDSGELTNVSSSGYYWSASPHSSNSGRWMYFSSSSFMWYSGSRAYGCSVRAVAEE